MSQPDVATVCQLMSIVGLLILYTKYVGHHVPTWQDSWTLLASIVRDCGIVGSSPFLPIQ